MAESRDQICARPLEGIFLDFYGTLAGGDRVAVEAICRAVIDDHRLGLDATELAVAWGRAYFDAIERLNGDGFRPLLEIERDTLVETVRTWIEAFDPTPYVAQLHRYLVAPPLFDEVREALARCRVPLCIVSNADEAELHAALRHHGLQFEFVVSSQLAESYKPATGIFEKALELTGWDRRAVVHIGDSLHSDVAGARAAGLGAVWIRREGRISDVGTESPDLTWSDLRLLGSL